RFSNLDDLEILLGGNVPKNPPKPKTKPDGSGGSTPTPTPNPLEDPKDFFEQYKTQIFIGLTLLGILFYIYTQKEEENEDTKKLMQQMMLMRTMNSSNKINEE